MAMTDAERSRRYRARHSERVREYQRTYRLAHREKVLERHRRYRDSHQDERRAQFLAYRPKRREACATTRYGITRTIRDWMYESQDGACAGCKTPMPDADLQIDHDHACCPANGSCGRCVRGLLCRSCNIRDVLAPVFEARFA